MRFEHDVRRVSSSKLYALYYIETSIKTLYSRLPNVLGLLTILRSTDSAKYLQFIDRPRKINTPKLIRINHLNTIVYIFVLPYKTYFLLIFVRNGYSFFKWFSFSFRYQLNFYCTIFSSLKVETLTTFCSESFFKCNEILLLNSQLANILRQIM